ncbi:flagellar GTP-binding protein [Paludisphaera sp.]|uniref:flagellar biosynthesis protein FlhF n=1 Tax=Paludisphaera sp. TaxID=2017432 RepID=UPI00301E3866
MSAAVPAGRATETSGPRTYRGRTMREALARVRRDLGGDAVILAAREVRRRRLFGLGDGAGVEVEASSAPEGSAPARFAVEAWPPATPEPAAIYARLLEADAPEPFARLLARAAAAATPPDDAASAARRALEDALAVAPPIRPVPGTRRVVALVGPTGVGKTTTIAKLAAALKLKQGASVGLLSADGRRIGAHEQLRAFADLLDAPMAVADGPDAARAALGVLEGIDVVLVDTPGVPPRDSTRVAELAGLLAALRPDEIHLTLAAPTSARGLRAAVDRLAPARPDRLILTKLDEAETLGPLLAVLGRADRAVSHLTTGPAAPDDLEAATRGRLARLILGEEAA